MQRIAALERLSSEHHLGIQALHDREGGSACRTRSAGARTPG